MKILLLGATGRTGRLLASQALAEGHEVTAFARDPARMTMVHSRLRVIPGDVLDAESVDRAVIGHDAILGALGFRAWRPPPVLSQGMRNVFDAMERHLVRRVVVLSAAGALREDAGSTIGNLGIGLFRRLLPGVYAEHGKMLHEMRERDLDWVAVRAVLLTNSRKRGRYRVAMEGIPSGGFRISRGDVAEFMIRQLTTETYVRKMPSLAY